MSATATETETARRQMPQSLYVGLQQAGYQQAIDDVIKLIEEEDEILGEYCDISELVTRARKLIKWP